MNSNRYRWLLAAQREALAFDWFVGSASTAVTITLVRPNDGNVETVTLSCSGDSVDRMVAPDDHAKAFVRRQIAKEVAA